jgi:DNA replication protein DnaC
MNIIKINTLDGNTFEGFKINSQKELPKKAFLHLCTYDEKYNNYNIYRSVSKKGTKIYILKTKI